MSVVLIEQRMVAKYQVSCQACPWRRMADSLDQATGMCREHGATHLPAPAPVDTKHWPPRFGRDHGEQITMGEIASRVADKLDAGDEDGAADAIDELLLFGAWGWVLHPDVVSGTDSLGYPVSHLRAGERVTLNKDLRGAIIAAYKAGRSRTKEQP